jgi:hypothetical protein
MKNSSDNIGNRTRERPVCNAVPQLTASPRAPKVILSDIKSRRWSMLLHTPTNLCFFNPNGIWRKECSLSGCLRTLVNPNLFESKYSLCHLDLMQPQFKIFPLRRYTHLPATVEMLETFLETIDENLFSSSIACIIVSSISKAPSLQCWFQSRHR